MRYHENPCRLLPPALRVAMIAIVFAGCADERPATWVVRNGQVVAAVWDCADSGRAKSVLRAWASAPIPPDEPALPIHDDDFLRKLLPPDDAIPEWSMSSPPQNVTPDRLADFLRRSSSDYLAFGVRGVVSAEYWNPRLGKHPELRVDVFDMGTPENAFGLYSQRRLAAGDIRPIGAEASLGAREIYVWQDRYQFFVTIYEYADDTREALIAFARHVSDTIGVGGAPPSLVDSTLVEGVVPRSHRWFRTVAQAQVASRRSELLLLPLGPSVRGVVASLALEDGLTCDAFYIYFPETSLAVDAYGSLRAALETTSTINDERLGDSSFRAVTPLESTSE